MAIPAIREFVKKHWKISVFSQFFGTVNGFCIFFLFELLSRLSSKNTGTRKGIDGRTEDIEA